MTNNEKGPSGPFFNSWGRGASRGAWQIAEFVSGKDPSPEQHDPANHGTNTSSHARAQLHPARFGTIVASEGTPHVGTQDSYRRP